MFIPNSTNIKILTPNGFSSFKGLLKSEKEVFRVQLDNGKNIRVSQDHRLKGPKGFIRITDLLNGDLLMFEGTICSVRKVIKEHKKEILYDPVAVELDNEYISNKLISHNCADFLGTGDTFIDSDVLTRLKDNVSEDFYTKYNNRLRVFSEPKNGHEYLLCVDPSLGRGKDYSAYHLIDLYNGEQVQEFYSNKLPINELIKIISNEASLYNTAYVVCERNGIGRAVIDGLFYDHEYENVWMDEKDFGIQVSNHNRDQILGVLEESLREGWYKIRSERSVSELLTFVIDEKTGKIQADEGQHDDLVLSLALGSWAIKKLGANAPLFVNKDSGNEDKYNIVSPISIRDKTVEEFSDDFNYMGSGESKKEYYKWLNQ